MKYKLWIVFAGLIFMLASCKIGKKYTRPELNLPEKIAGVKGDSVSVDSINWWALYTDPVLQQLIVRTLEYNQDMLIAAARVKELMALQRIDKADLFPKVDAKVDADREHDQTPDNTFELKALLLLKRSFFSLGNSICGENYGGRIRRLFPATCKAWRGKEPCSSVWWRRLPNLISN